MSQRMKGWLMKLDVPSREVAALHAGTNLAYLNKKMYTTPAEQLPSFKAKIAVGLDQASDGALDFRDMLDGGREIDWEYVRRKLNAEARKTGGGT